MRPSMKSGKRRDMVRGAVWSGALLVALLVCAGEPAFARASSSEGKAAASGPRTKVEQYARARRAYEQEAEAYWQSVADKRRARFAKRRDGEPVVLDDYVLTQPPLYAGPPRPPGYRAPRRDPRAPIVRIPHMSDFLAAASEQFHFAPERPRSEAEFMQAYARVATAAGLTRDQAVRIYAFETGGNGTYDVQAGLTTPRRKGARPISPAVGYNQLLNTNTIGLLAANGDAFMQALANALPQSAGPQRQAMERKIEALRRMIVFCRTVPYAWNEHDKLAKFTRGGVGVHAALLDRDLGPLLQTQKLLDSVAFARGKGYAAPLTAVQLELMNFTGDGNGFDMVLMPQELRERVPTSNFFLRGGYERNPIARRTGTVAALYAAIDAKMDRASREAGARELAAAFQGTAMVQAD
jgi:hypothetical protein